VPRRFRARRDRRKTPAGWRSPKPGGIAKVLLLLVVAATIVCLTFLPGYSPAQDASTSTRFRTVEVFVDSGAQSLAAYQLSFTATGSDVRIVGIEGGEHPAFTEPPHYDPKAIQNERAILAAFNTASADNLPKGRTRVATIHVQISGTAAPAYAVKLEAAANREGSRVAGQTSFQERSGP
jgi:hypothetical protein